MQSGETERAKCSADDLSTQISGGYFSSSTSLTCVPYTRCLPRDFPNLVISAVQLQVHSVGGHVSGG